MNTDRRVQKCVCFNSVLRRWESEHVASSRNKGRRLGCEDVRRVGVYEVRIVEVGIRSVGIYKVRIQEIGIRIVGIYEVRIPVAGR